MAETERRERHRIFITANILLLIVAGLHTSSQFIRPTDPADLAMMAAMRGHHVPVGLGWTPSVLDITHVLAFTMSISLVGMVVVNLGMLRFARISPGLLRRLSLLNAIVVGAIVLLSFAYQVAPPFLTLAIVDVFFIIAWLGAARTAVS
jgi:hypothetical protein